MPAEARAREHFVQATAEHEMTVLRDDGVYRHLRFQKPGTSMYHFDLVTWPGYLAVGGDTQHFVFRRTTDMFEFFDQPGYGIDSRWGINEHYWAEKLVAPKSADAETYSEDRYRQRVLEWFDHAVDQLDVSDDEVIPAVFGLRLAVAEQLLRDDQWDDYDESLHFEDGARNRLQRFTWTPPVLSDALRQSGYRPPAVTIEDAWEWDLKDYDYHFQWACWAIVWGIQQYRAARAPRRVPRIWKRWLRSSWGRPAEAVAA